MGKVILPPMEDMFTMTPSLLPRKWGKSAVAEVLADKCNGFCVLAHARRSASHQSHLYIGRGIHLNLHDFVVVLEFENKTQDAPQQWQNTPRWHRKTPRGEGEKKHEKTKRVATKSKSESYLDIGSDYRSWSDFSSWQGRAWVCLIYLAWSCAWKGGQSIYRIKWRWRTRIKGGGHDF